MSAMEKAKELADAKAAAQRLRESQQVTEATPAVVEATIDDGEPASEDGKMTSRECEPCTIEQVESIKAAMAEAKQTGVVDIVDRVKAKLAASGMAKLSDMSMAEASMLLNAIHTKNLQAFFDNELVGVVPF
jgi:hypothetical protein